MPTETVTERLDAADTDRETDRRANLGINWMCVKSNNGTMWTVAIQL